MVARSAGGREVAGSNPVAPIFSVFLEFLITEGKKAGQLSPPGFLPLSSSVFAEYPVLRKYQRSLIKQIVSISENKGFLFDIDLEFDEFLIRNFYLNNFLIDSWQKLLLNSP